MKNQKGRENFEKLVSSVKGDLPGILKRMEVGTPVKVTVMEYRELERRPYSTFIGQVRVKDASGGVVASQVSLVTEFDKKHPRSWQPRSGEVFVDIPWDYTEDADLRLRLQGGVKRRKTILSE